jgi:hypothetical protein
MQMHSRNNAAHVAAWQTGGVVPLEDGFVTEPNKPVAEQHLKGLQALNCIDKGVIGNYIDNPQHETSISLPMLNSHPDTPKFEHQASSSPD